MNSCLNPASLALCSQIATTSDTPLLPPRTLHHCHHRTCTAATLGPTSLAPYALHRWHRGPCIAGITDSTHGSSADPGTAGSAPLVLESLPGWHCWPWQARPAWLAAPQQRAHAAACLGSVGWAAHDAGRRLQDVAAPQSQCLRAPASSHC